MKLLKEFIRQILNENKFSLREYMKLGESKAYTYLKANLVKLDPWSLTFIGLEQEFNLWWKILKI